jgi:hypothetical protein
VGVAVPMMKVGIVRVFVAHRRVVMPVGVRLAGRVISRVDMLMMLMVHRLVAVLVFVTFRQVEIDANGHQDRRADQLSGYGLIE